MATFATTPGTSALFVVTFLLGLVYIFTIPGRRGKKLPPGNDHRVLVPWQSEITN